MSPCLVQLVTCRQDDYIPESLKPLGLEYGAQARPVGPLGPCPPLTTKILLGALRLKITTA